MLSRTTTIHLWQPRGGYSQDAHGGHDGNGSHGANSSHGANVVRVPRSSGESLSGLRFCRRRLFSQETPSLQFAASFAVLAFCA